MTLFVERTFLKIWKSSFEVQSCLETIIVVEQAVLPRSVRSLGIEVLIVYIAGKLAGLRMRSWEMNLDLSWVDITGSQSETDVNSKDDINYLVARDRLCFCAKIPHIEEWEVKRRKEALKQNQREGVGECKGTDPPQLKSSTCIEREIWCLIPKNTLMLLECWLLMNQLILPKEQEVLLSTISSSVQGSYKG